jgi:hypothetical protein
MDTIQHTMNMSVITKTELTAKFLKKLTITAFTKCSRTGSPVVLTTTIIINTAMFTSPQVVATELITTTMQNMTAEVVGAPNENVTKEVHDIVAGVDVPFATRAPLPMLEGVHLVNAAVVKFKNRVARSVWIRI